MISKRTLIVLIAIGNLVFLKKSFAQHEQIVFNYVVDSILPTYENEQISNFQGYTSINRPLIGFFKDCNSLELDSIQLNAINFSSKKIPIQSNDNRKIRITQKPTKKRLLIEISSAFQIDSRSFVYVVCSKASSYIDHYLFEVSDNVVLGLCHQGEIP